MTLEKWNNKLFDAIQREPPPDFRRVALWQVLAADKELFARLSEDCRDGLSADGAGNLPMDVAIKALLIDPNLNLFLSHQPMFGKGRSKGKQTSQGFEPRQDGGNYGGDKAHNQARGGRGKGGKGGRGKNKSWKRDSPYVSPSLPPGLEGCWPRLGREPLCMKYNLGDCPESGVVADGDKCSRGLHKCLHAEVRRYSPALQVPCETEVVVTNRD